jgi:hypothetical protein
MTVFFMGNFLNLLLALQLDLPGKNTLESAVIIIKLFHSEGQHFNNKIITTDPSKAAQNNG